MFVSYAQNFEDVMLWRALKGVENGFYIDIGAQDPVADSVSKAFHELGWRGVHVEPTDDYAQRLREQRQGDTVVQAIVAPRNAQTILYQIEGTGLSTTVAELASRHAGNNFKIETRNVESITLDDLLDMHKDREIHWLKIDTEGSETAVLGSWAQSAVRPWIVVVESVDPLTHDINSAGWEGKLLSLGYAFAYFDGVNKFYVSDQHKNLLPKFDVPPNLFDDFSLSGEASSPFVSSLARQNKELLAARATLEETLSFVRKRFDEAFQQSEDERGRLHAQIEEQALWWSAQVKSACAQVESARAQVELTRARLEAVHQSTSWRITAPIRIISRARRAIIPTGRRILSLLRRAVTSFVHWLARLCRRRFPGLFYRLATNRLTRGVFDIFPKPLHERPARAEALTSGLEGTRFLETLPILLSRAGNWKPGQRIDA